MNNPAQDSYQLYIGGEWVDASDGATLDSFCPATGEKLTRKLRWCKVQLAAKEKESQFV